jgi:hypothetical protein
MCCFNSFPIYEVVLQFCLFILLLLGLNLNEQTLDQFRIIVIELLFPP